MRNYTNTQTRKAGLHSIKGLCKKLRYDALKSIKVKKKTKELGKTLKYIDKPKETPILNFSGIININVRKF